MTEASREELLDFAQARVRELEELRQQQAATAEVLRAINRPGFDLDAVLNTLTKSAADLCEAGSSSLFLRDGEQLVARGTANLDAEQEAFVRGTPAPIDEASYIGRAVLHGTVANVPDFLAWSGSRLSMYQQKLSFRALLVVPLMRDGQGLGVFTLASKRIGEFTPRQVELVQTFADQATIAVQNARLIGELQERTDELERSLGQLNDTQERLARSERLAALGRLVAGIAHEMNTPVGNALTISTTLEHDIRHLTEAVEAGRILRSDLTRGLARLGQGSALMRTNLSRAIGLVERFRQVSSGKVGGERGRIEVRAWADSLFRNHAAFGRSRHRWTVACPDELAIESHRDTWTEIVNGLLDNTLQHAFRPDEAGEVALSAHREPSGEVVLDYRDSGCGIAPDDIPHVFDPFYTTARGSGAAGLGLHIVHNLVASLGGQIAAASPAGSGARFTIRLPAG